MSEAALTSAFSPFHDFSTRPSSDLKRPMCEDLPQPKRRIIKPQRNPELRDQTPEDCRISAAQMGSTSGKWTGYFQDTQDAKDKLARWLGFHRKLSSFCSFPHNDDTFPSTPEETQRLVKMVFSAITDWSNYREWTQAVEVSVKDNFIDELLAERRERHPKNFDEPYESLKEVSMEELRPSSQELLRILPSLQEQQKKILGREEPDITWEWISWLLVVRAEFRPAPSHRFQKECRLTPLLSVSFIFRLGIYRMQRYDHSKARRRLPTGAGRRGLRKLIEPSSTE